MKKLIKAGILFGLMFLMAGSAWALPIAAGDTIIMSVTWTNPDPYYVPYLMTNTDTSDTAAWDQYFSFCIEKTGTFYDGHTYNVMSVTDTVTNQTKWLYASFLDGKLTDATKVQEAIWYWENSISSYEYAWDGEFASAFSQPGATTFLAGWDIQAVNFSNGQNQVVGSNNNPVPEPATMVLFGIGLLSMAGAGRKKIKK